MWKSDGTASGTVIVKDIYIGSDASQPYTPIAIGDTLYFTARDGIYGDELWKSDGTANGTVLVKDISYGEGWGSPTDFTAIGNLLYFVASDYSGWNLWKYSI